jgi:hypothetical protein
LTRPPTGSLNPVMAFPATFRPGSLSASGGNGNLKSYEADNFDVSLESSPAPVIATSLQRRQEIDAGNARQHAGLRRFTDAVLHARNELTRDRATDDAILELDAGATPARKSRGPNHTARGNIPNSNELTSMTAQAANAQDSENR